MKDLSTQLVLKWARKGSDHDILVTDDLTRLTLDTIALCTMDFRFNSFYQDEMHPFVTAMLNVLYQAGLNASRPAILSRIIALTGTAAQVQSGRKVMGDTAQSIIEQRRRNPVEKKDFLNTLLYGIDPQTGERMRDELISTNMTTFLIAGKWPPTM